ncbi:hypothetical protein Hanom_Chr12g01141971 [Helianthus anomalus]
MAFMAKYANFHFMSIGERHEDSSEEMSAALPPLKWSRETFDSMIRKFRFPDSWGARYPDEGQMAADAPAGYITLFGIILLRVTFDYR